MFPTKDFAEYGRRMSRQVTLDEEDTYICSCGDCYLVYIDALLS